MKTIIRLSENDLHRIIGDAVKRILKEGAYDKYAKDAAEIELDSVQDNLNMAYAYSHMNDPLTKKVTGPTFRHMLSQDVSRMDSDSEDYNKASQDFITNEFLNTPNAARNFDKFPRYSRKDSGLKDYNNLSGGSERIRRYKQMKGAV